MSEFSPTSVFLFGVCYISSQNNVTSSSFKRILLGYE